MTFTDDLTIGLRRWTKDHDPHVRAAVELLLWHDFWLRRNDFREACVIVDHGDVRISWSSARGFCDQVSRASPSELAILDLAVALGEDRYRLGIMGSAHSRAIAVGRLRYRGDHAMTELRTDGPHSPEYTREVGNLLAEAVRVLNYATLGDCPGLEYPGDAYTLLGALYTATQGLPQLLGQVASFVTAQAAAGKLGDTQGRSAVQVAGVNAACLALASQLAGDLTGRLQAAQNAISGLYVKGENDG